MKIDRRGNWTLLGLLVAVAIIVVLAVMMFGGKLNTVGKNSDLVDQESEKETVYGKAMDKAKGEDCRERLRQIRMGIETYKASAADETNPPSLDSLGMGVSSDYFQCPVSNEKYVYDQASGTVRCQYQGHSGF